MQRLAFRERPPSSLVLDLPVHRMSEHALVEWLLWRADRGHGAVVTDLTAHSLVGARRDPGFRALLGRADLRYADGMGVVMAARALGGDRIAKVTANAFFERLCVEALLRDRRLAFVGGRPGVAEAVARRVVELASRSGGDRPELEARVLAHHGYPTVEEDRRLGDRLKSLDPHLVFVGMGQPRQEAWALAQRTHLPRAVLHCVGGLFDTASGRLRAAPPWLRSAGLEWTLRLAQEPRRLWRRYLLGLPSALALVLSERLRSSRGRR